MSVFPATGRYSTLFLLVLAWSSQSLVYSLPADLLQMLVTGSAVLLGAMALGWLRPARVGLTAPQAMLSLGAIGMVLGLMLDSHVTGLETLASLCGMADRELSRMLQLHWAVLPWMHVGMWVGGFAAIPLLRAIRPACRKQYCARMAQNVACSAWMTVGMSAGVLAFEYLAAQSGAREVKPSAAAMLGGMFSGMVWGMVASVALYRLYFRGQSMMASNFNRRGAGVL